MTKTNRRMARQPTRQQGEEIAAPSGMSAPTKDTKATSKIASVLALLRRDNGATLDEIAAVTGRQSHTIRASLTALRKKGHVIEKTTRDNATCYHIVADS